MEDVDKNKKIKKLIKDLHRKYNYIPKDINLYFQTDNNFIELEPDETINNYNDIKDQSVLTIIEITN